MYGKEIATPFVYDELPPVVGGPLLRGAGASEGIRKDERVETAVFAEDETFKDISKLLDAHKHSDEVREELSRLKHKYAHWPNTVEVQKKTTSADMMASLDARLIAMGLMK